MAQARKGQILRIGGINGELVSTYPTSPRMMKYLVNDFYNDLYRLYKADGFTRYGTAGVFNAIMGKEIFAGMFASNTMFTAIGARPYNREGVRIAYRLAQKGHIGATTIQDGDVPDSVMMPIKQIREPYKDLPFAFDYGLGLAVLQAHDDTIDKDQYIEMLTDNYVDGLDYDLLRQTQIEQDTFNGVETCLNSLSRVVGSSVEVGETYNGVEITPDMVSPWGGVASDIYEYRDADRINNFCGYVNDTEGTLQLTDMDKLYSNCAPYWRDQANPNNKIIGLSIVALETIGALMNAQNIWRESVFVQRDFNGVKTMPGRDGGGILLNSYRNIPMFMDGNYNYDADTDRIGVNLGEIHMVDLDHNYISVLTPTEFRSTDDFAITRQLREKMVVTSRMELRADKFLGSGKIVNKTA